MAKINYIIIGIITAIILAIGGYLLLIPGSEETNCSLSSGDELQQCCNQWAQENNIVTPACVGYWEIESGSCSWKCESSEQNISEKSLAENITDANNELTFDLYSRYKTNERNLFYSPYSISSALTMTYEGAKGQTADEMQEVLHLPDNKQQIREDYLSFYNEINKADKTYKLSTANALWAQEDYPFEQNYFSTVDQYYNGKVTNLDFKTKTEESRITINDWVENKTNNKIKDLIPSRTLTSTTKLVLTNAIYFKANWTNQFEAEDTIKNYTFNLDTGQTTKVDMMYQKDFFNYGETEDVKVLEMDYLDNDLSMLVILPKENNLQDIEQNINKEKLSGWKQNMELEKTRVYLPKFKFETKYYMAQDLSDMGMPTAFKYPDADFTTMSSTDELFISQVIHQTFIEVAEYGTEAAAATAVIIKATSAPLQEQPKIFKADHPFIFIIQHKDTGKILFIGRMSNPNQN